MPTVHVQLSTHYRVRWQGQTLVRIGRSESPWLQEIGWTLVHRPGKGVYDYMRPPLGHRGRSVVVACEIPTMEDIQTLATQLHDARQPYNSDFHGWPVRYTPRRTVTLRWKTTHAGMVDTPETPLQESEDVYPAEFWIGSWSAWSLMATWKDGNDQPPYWTVDEDRLVEKGVLPIAS
jgi:hypothetical protein